MAKSRMKKLPEKVRNLRLSLIATITVLLILFTYLLPPHPQPLEYHNFANDLELFGIPNFWNVFSNLPFLIVGILGLLFLRSPESNKHFVNKSEKTFYYSFFFSICLVCFGSSYYHLHPHNSTLVWDRAPIVMSVAAIFSAMIYERVNKNLGHTVLFPFIIVAISSAFYWFYTETKGVGDLRFYGFVQIYPLVIVPLLIILLPGIYNSGKYILMALASYGIARLLEIFDVQVFAFTHKIMAGHPIKHVFAALGTYMVIVYLRKRKAN